MYPKLAAAATTTTLWALVLWACASQHVDAEEGEPKAKVAKLASAKDLPTAKDQSAPISLSPSTSAAKAGEKKES